LQLIIVKFFEIIKNKKAEVMKTDYPPTRGTQQATEMNTLTPLPTMRWVIF